jgi:selenium-binding protein 1
MASSESGGTDKEPGASGMEHGCLSIQDCPCADNTFPRSEIMLMTPDPTFYPSPAMAAQAPSEALGYVALINPLADGRPDALGVVDLDPSSPDYGRIVGRADMPEAGDELHHFGWNACSSCLCPYAPHPHMERRYLVVPGIHSSRIHILDVKADPRRPQIVKVIEPETVFGRTGYAAPHTVHCGPDGIFVSALGAPDGNGPGGTFIIDPETFDVRGRWEIDRGPQELAYDVWWHLGQDTMITSTWGTPNMVRNGVNAELLLGGKYGNKLHVWDLRRRRHVQELDLGAEQQMALELRPAHDPRRAYGFASVVLSLKDLSSSIWVWYRSPRESGANGSKAEWAVKKVIEIPAEAADPELLPPLLQGFKAVAPLVTDINLSVDDRYLYVSCWGLGKFIQYDVSDPFNPKEIASIRLGGIVGRSPHAARPELPLNGGPQMVEVSRDGRRIYFTNSLYTPWDKQFYPDGIRGWIAKADVPAGGGAMTLDRDFFVETGNMRPHQIRLGGGDASSDSYCYA